MRNIVIGCGDVGRRIVKALVNNGVKKTDIHGVVRSSDSQQQCIELGITATRVDLDYLPSDGRHFHLDQAEVYYTVAPQKDDVVDRRSESLLEHLESSRIKPSKAVVISTTGVYGDCKGGWVTETSPTKPQTERGQRRLDLERQWLSWGARNSVPVVVLRVPGIYSFSRLPRQRIAKRTPVVSADECGYTNRIHADDLARVCIAAMREGRAGELYNATDGTPGKISEYLQVAAQALGEKPLPEISMAQAHIDLSAGMLSYLNESRKISNQKMLAELGIQLKYPDFRKGVKF